MFITHIYVLKDYDVEIVWDIVSFFGMEEMIYCDEHWHGYGAVGMADFDRSFLSFIYFKKV